MFSFSDKYRLEIHWDSIDYSKGQAKLENCFLTGPVLSQVQDINDEDFIRLDFGGQYKIFINNFYILKLSWKGQRKENDKIFLSNVFLENVNINSTPTLKKSDYIVVDTSKHEDEQHNYHMNYMAYVLNKDGGLYDFRS